MGEETVSKSLKKKKISAEIPSQIIDELQKRA